MTEAKMREAARQFFYKWKNKGNEDEDARSYWIDLMANVFGAENVTDRLQFEKKVVGSDGNTKRIDVYIPETRVLIEQKSLGIPLDKPQSGHGGKTPYEQAKYYDNYLPYGEKARWILTSNFAEIWIYDMEERKPEANVIKLGLSDLQTKFHLLDFLLDRETRKITQETEISLKAGEIVGELYDALRAQYKNPDSPDTLQSLNKLCVRLVFCLYGEDADVFGRKNIFHDYLSQFRPHQIRKALRDLFRVLNQRLEERDPYLADDDPILASFPYVNGNLFGADDIEIPPFSEEILDLLLRKASEEFDWSGINGTIFGAVFESTLNPETRRSGGMHYTSIENIHKLIDPLFLDDLKEEFRQIRQMDVWKHQKPRLEAFQDKLASLRFLDPAAGSGNFLTETFTSLRRLENEVIALLTRGQMSFGEAKNPVKVSIGQFAGIEINDFAVTVARTALWIAENQMLRETEDIVRMSLDFLPLKTSAKIVQGNALRMEWEDVIEKERLHYIIGNPPFSGARWMGTEQKSDVTFVFGKKWQGVGDLDYVCCWFKKASDYIKGTSIRVAFVSTNSISQGGSVANIWRPLFEEGIHIDFAYQTFVWDSEAAQKAHVHCVIVGFSEAENKKPRIIFSGDSSSKATTINGYLLDADNIFIDKRMTPISEVPGISLGGQAIDDGNFILSKEEKDELLKKEPEAEPFIRPYMMGKDFIERSPRYCIWLVGADPARLKKCHNILKRVHNVQAFRASSTRTSTLKAAERPTLFASILECEEDYIAFPKVSSQNRRYIPMDYLPPKIIPGDKLFVLQNASLFHFGILTSNVHMAWTRAVCGRLKSDYSYSNTIVYNNFPWPDPTQEEKKAIEKTAQAILDARTIYPKASLADLYDPLTMPPELRKAHQANDKAVMKAYGMPIKETDEAGCVGWLMRLYQEWEGRR